MNKKQLHFIATTLRDYPSFPVDHKRLEQTVHGANEMLRQAQVTRRTSLPEFYKAQLSFISWKVWMQQLLIVAGMGVLLYQFVNRPHGDMEIVMLASVAAPLLVITGLQTLTRSLNCHMIEIELSTWRRLEKLTMVRMSLLGVADLIGLIILAILLNTWIEMEIVSLLLYLLVPFNVSCLGSLWLMNRVRNANCGYYCLAYCGLLIIVQVICTFTPSLSLFLSSATGTWQIALVLSLGGIVYETRGLSRNFRSLETAVRLHY
ncbi:hypothetical protein NST04_24035 [Paenibacillus sp. FSL H7-0756]|uniref:hypothetical protein n=1 Tax=Paenibacillus sp. FSL H7-0756 TaxID=2954738 RepID=UPI0030FC7EEA